MFFKKLFVLFCHNLKRKSAVGYSLAGVGVGLGSAAVAFVSKHISDTDSDKTQPLIDNNKSQVTSKSSYGEAVLGAKDIIERIKDEVGSPGMVVAVSIDGKMVWSEGFGFSDVENRVACTPSTVMRIASISKPITMAIVARLWEMGLVNLDKPIQEYVPTFPLKTFEGEPVSITTRQLLSHLGGVRSYDRSAAKQEPPEKKTTKNVSEQSGPAKTNATKEATSELEFYEYLLKKNFKSIPESLGLFKEDPLVHKPGTTYLYTTHGWTLISAVIEGASKKKFTDLLKCLFIDLGMDHTYLDENDPIIYHRSRYYTKDKKGRLRNVPYVDNSYKWAGGGLLSTVDDLIRFGNVMLYSYQCDLSSTNHEQTAIHKHITGQKTNTVIKNTAVNDKTPLPGYLKQSTVETMWTLVPQTVDTQGNLPQKNGYGLGWMVQPKKHICGECMDQSLCVGHTGGAIGASSALFVLPADCKLDNQQLPSGIVVVIMSNMQSVNLLNTAIQIAKMFQQIKES